MENEPIILDFVLARKSTGSQNLRSGNEMISANDRLNFHVKAELAAHLRELGRIRAEECLRNLPEHVPFSPCRPCVVEITVHPPARWRNDVPNWYPTVKPLIDGCTDAGLFTDDSNEVIKRFVFEPGEKVDDKRYHVRLAVRDKT